MSTPEPTRPETADHAPIRVGVLGARGKVGVEVCRAVEAAPDTELVASVDAGDDIEELARAGAQVVVDFTHPDVVMDNLRFCIEHGIHAVVGTTGFDQARLDQLDAWLADAPGVGVLIAPNFSHRRDPDDALRRAGGAVLRVGRGRSSCTTPTRPTRPPAPPGARPS